MSRPRDFWLRQRIERVCRYGDGVVGVASVGGVANVPGMRSRVGPLRLVPKLVAKPWGGRRLADLGRLLPPAQLIGESWDVADLDAAATSVADPVTRVAAGEYAGRSLAELIARCGTDLLGAAAPTPTGRFPLLVKHLDARENLSVQVHPPADLVAGDPTRHHKTESWVVVGVEPGAQLYIGVNDGVEPADIERALGTPAVVPMLRRVEARVGDVHHLPAGLIHAVGAGCLLAEPQTPSDTTYRLYDWTAEYDRAPRTLHRDEAMACVRAGWSVNTAPPPVATGDGVLVSTAHYTIARTTVCGPSAVAVPARATARVVVLTQGSLTGDGIDDIPAGGVVVVPAAWSGQWQATGGTSWLDIDLVAG